jgi:hypothetical protein
MSDKAQAVRPELSLTRAMPRGRGARPEPSGRVRTFSLNSDEAHEALCEKRDPWVWGPGLPREPRVWEGVVVRDEDIPPRKKRGN